MQQLGRVTRNIASVTALGAAALLGCGDGLGPENVARLLTVDAAQLAGTVGAQLAKSPGVRAVTVEGKPVPDITVRFEVVEGGGQIAPADQTTDADGVARVGSWTLGPTAGNNRLRATIPGFGVEATITATGNAAEPSVVTVVSGDNQTGTAGRPISTSPTIRVTDAFQNAIPGVPVQFDVASGGGVLHTGLAISTNNAGEARAPIWVLGPVPGINTLTATAGSGTATITATGVRGPNAIRVVAGANQTGVVGQPLAIPPRLLVVDAEELPLGNAVVRFSVTNRGMVSSPQATTGPDGTVEVGWTLGTRAGANTLSASVGDVPPVMITVTGVPDAPVQVVVLAGNNQFGEVNKNVLIDPAVQVQDQYGNGVPGVDVTFTVTAGGGTVPNGVVTSSQIGSATPGAWRLGSDPGANTIEASIAAGARATIMVTALTAVFDIQIVRESGGGGTELTNALNQAARKWRTVVIGDLPSVSFANNPIPASSCGGEHAAIVDTIDDLRVLVYVRRIDGVGGTAAQAGPCYTRDATLLPVLGAMTFDADDVDRLATAGLLDDVALHELGHILGIGTIWDTLGFLVNPSLPGREGADTHFNGPLAIAAFDSIGGVRFTQSKVPVENTRGGPGTRDSHWRESTMTSEIMTGFIDPADNPLSTVTVQSLRDLGYVVNVFGADPFSLPFAIAVFEGEYDLPPGSIELGEHLIDQPITVVRRDGAITGIIRR